MNDSLCSICFIFLSHRGTGKTSRWFKHSSDHAKNEDDQDKDEEQEQAASIDKETAETTAGSDASEENITTPTELDKDPVTNDKETQNSNEEEVVSLVYSVF